MTGLIAGIKNKLRMYRKAKGQEWVDSRSIAQDELRLHIDRENRFRIYCKDNEITKWFGLNTGIFSDGKWYSSSDCRLKAEKLSPQELLVHFDFTSLSLIQTWRLKVMPHTIISWDVHIQLKDSLRIDRRNTALFLSKNYQEWTIPLTRGRFETAFTKEWKNIALSEKNPELIGVISSLEEFPSVTLRTAKVLTRNW